MPDHRLPKVPTTYDRIARFYDVDMAQNMRFDDVAFYAHQCARQRGRVLEVGCGNGRILLPLLRDGHDAYGIDASAPMLRELARKSALARLPMRGAQADARRLPFPRATLACVLCPYSLVTYLVSDDDLATFLRGVRDVLVPGGVVVIDAFVPRPVEAQDEFTPDYRRPFGAFTLARAKRITPLPDGTNRIERCYEMMSGGGHAVETIEVTDVIRPRPPAALRAALGDAGFARIAEAWDYGTRPGADGAQFVTLTARSP